MRVGSLPLQLRATDFARAGELASLFRHAPRTGEQPVGRFRFVRAEEPFLAREPERRIDSLDLWYPAPDGLLVAAPGALRAAASPHEVVVTSPDTWNASLFRQVSVFGLTHLEGSHGWHVLHGGAIVTDRGAILVLGASGSGKSTVVASALATNRPVLGDDIIAVQARRSGLVVVGIGRPITVPEDLVPAHCSVERRAVDDPRGRVELGIESRSSSEHLVSAVLLTGHASSTEAQLDRVTSEESLQHVLSASASTGDRRRFPETFSISAAIARAPSYRLAHGSDHGSRLVQAATRLDELEARISQRG